MNELRPSNTLFKNDSRVFHLTDLSGGCPVDETLNRVEANMLNHLINLAVAKQQRLRGGRGMVDREYFGEMSSKNR